MRGLASKLNGQGRAELKPSGKVVEDSVFCFPSTLFQLPSLYIIDIEY